MPRRERKPGLFGLILPVEDLNQERSHVGDPRLDGSVQIGQ